MKRKLIATVSILILAATTISYGSELYAKYAPYGVFVNSERLTAQALNMNGSTYLPTRAIAEALGVDIGWTGKSVEINTVDVEKLKEACVMIYAKNDNSTMQGSGVYVDYDKVLTANHISDGRTDIQTSEGTTLTVNSSDVADDAAILEPSKEVKPVKIGDSDEVKLGDKVIVIASPKAKEDTIVYATIIDTDPRGLVIKTTLGGGASGGAVFDMNGCLIGIIIAADGTSDAVETKELISPINDIREAL